MTVKHAIQTIARAVILQNPGVDTNDLPWEPVPGHGDYATLVEAWDAAEEFDQIFDDRYAHRVVDVDGDEPEPPPVPAPPVKAPTPRRQLSEYRSQQSFSRVMAQLEDGLQQEWSRVHLDAFAELCEIHLAMSGSSVLTRRWREKLDALRAEVATRGNLRLVK